MSLLHFLPSLSGTALVAVVAAGLGGQMQAQEQGGGDAAKIERLERQVRLLRKQNSDMAASLAAANSSETESAAAMARMKSRLAALDRSIFGSSDERLIEAVTSVEALTRRVNELEGAALGLSSTVQDYLTTAVAADPAARASVEEAIRVLDTAVGLRQKPRPDIVKGTLTDARVVSIDSESGLLVLNIGKDTGASPGMNLTIRRGDLTLGEALIVDVRDSIAGAFVESLTNPQNTVRLDDTASLITNRR